MSLNVDDVNVIKEAISIPTNITVESLVHFAASIGCEIGIVFTMKSEKEEEYDTN